ncbi:MAG: undecaprenyldiphospho-muramoylpentapeptide beta-N-acetylglucosaminyltransferase [Myxococcales bacterium]|nr:undecaprenyldiphospho-muramoylpentapeptide beta-N-acetylglucosaminyltransferase [Myxococcales bacterium]
MTRRIVIAGGGTGGHITPALALAEVFSDRGDQVTLIGTRRGLETRMVPAAGFALRTLDSRPLIGRTLPERAGALWALAGATRDARRALRELRAELVVSVGGYAAVPVTLAAALARIPIALVEPNALPGFANRAMARFAKRLFSGFEITGERLAGRAADNRVRLVGVPLRQALIETLADAPPARVPEAPFRIFVFGGSQGARQLNRGVPDALASLGEEFPPTSFEVVHQTGEADRERVAAAYEASGFDATVLAFETDMAGRYRWSDLVVCRAGALTIAELTLAQRPALLVPLGHVGGGEQIENARALDAAGAARILPAAACNAESWREAFLALLHRRAEWPAMGARAGGLARPAAAREIAAECLSLLSDDGAGSPR